MGTTDPLSCNDQALFRPVVFHRAVFSGGSVYFSGAKFSGSQVDFSSAEFSGASPVFDFWIDGPPDGLLLPADNAAEDDGGS